MTEVIIALLLGLLIFFGVNGVIATAYLWWLYRKDRRYHRGLRPPARPGYVSFTMALASTLVMAPGLWVAFLSARRLIGLAPLEGTQVFTVLAIALLMTVPTVLAGRLAYLRWVSAPPRIQRRDGWIRARTTAPSDVVISPILPEDTDETDEDASFDDRRNEEHD